LNAMEDKSEYLERLQMVIHQLHGCDSKHIETVRVQEGFNGKTVWEADVEVFSVTHYRATRAYAWSHVEGPNDENERFVAVLELPPVKSAGNAVRVAIIAQSRKR